MSELVRLPQAKTRMEVVKDDASVVQSSGAAPTSATQRRPAKASKKEQAKETGM